MGSVGVGLAWGRLGLGWFGVGLDVWWVGGGGWDGIALDGVGVGHGGIGWGEDDEVDWARWMGWGALRHAWWC